MTAFAEKERLGSGEITVLAQHHIYQGAVSIDRPIEITPATVDLDVGFVDIPTLRHAVASALLTEFVGKDRGEFRLPLPDGLVTEHDAADEKHLARSRRVSR